MKEKDNRVGVPAKNFMKTTFDILPDTLTPAEANAQLKPGNYGVVLDSNGMPLSVIKSDDLNRADRRGASSLHHPLACLPPTIITDCETEMRILVESKPFTLLNIGARGAVVLEDKKVAGVLPVDILGKYIGNSDYKSLLKDMLTSASPVDTSLGGSSQPQLGIITCQECGYRNEVIFIDENNLPTCQNPDPDKPHHTLKLS